VSFVEETCHYVGKLEAKTVKISKISKFVLSVLIGFVALGLVAPQQAKAVPTLNGTFFLTGAVASLTTNQVNTLDLSSGFFTVTGASGDFVPFDGMQVTFTDETMTWTGSGHNVSLINGFSFNVQGTNGFLLMSNMDSLDYAAFGPIAGSPFATATLVGSSLQQVFVDGVLEKEARMTYRIGIDGARNDGGVEGQPFISVVPERGSTLGLLAIGLVGLVAVERLRRKITPLQNR
jgi:hypothetical protein